MYRKFTLLTQIKNKYWNFVIILLEEKMFFTGKKLHDFYFDLPDKMLFFTGQFIHSLIITYRRKEQTSSVLRNS